ncbi:hypothetical protein G4B88_028385 [Cannabis sativa]|uniref:Syntaxin-5 N-terminal Sly1p-binding domain-containing protein n=1 Tax=Cannabis sativa TaxID=3483 RepID=A0A7J6EJL4_CANSA|nr:hypothetical protein G4B88_028385 [Cannabis sativa]
MHMKASQLSFRDRTHEFQSVADSASGPSSRSKSEINIILIDVVEREVDVGAVGAGDYFGSGSTAEERKEVHQKLLGRDLEQKQNEMTKFNETSQNLNKNLQSGTISSSMSRVQRDHSICKAVMGLHQDASDYPHNMTEHTQGYPLQSYLNCPFLLCQTLWPIELFLLATASKPRHIMIQESCIHQSDPYTHIPTLTPEQPTMYFVPSIVQYFKLKSSCFLPLKPQARWIVEIEVGSVRVRKKIFPSSAPFSKLPELYSTFSLPLDYKDNQF